MRSILNYLVNRSGKHMDFEIDEALSPYALVQVLWHVFVWSMRGLTIRFFIRGARGVLLLGRGVRVRHPQYLTVGKNLIIEDYAEIMALSRHGIMCGDHVTIGAYATIKPSSYYGRSIGEGLVIGDNSNIGRYAYIGCSGFITIGKNVMMGPRVNLFAENHNYAGPGLIKSQGVIRQPIVIEDDCWIASGVTILAGVTIGTGSVVAAGSVVTKDVPPYSVVAGIPAQVIKTRETR